MYERWGEKKKEEKSGRQTPLSHQGPHSPCLVVSTPALSLVGRGQPHLPFSVLCFSCVWGLSSGCPRPLPESPGDSPHPVTLRGEISWRCRSEHSLVPLLGMSLRMGSRPPASRRLPSFPEGCTSGLPRGYPRSPRVPSSVGVIPPGKQNRNLH